VATKRSGKPNQIEAGLDETILYCNMHRRAAFLAAGIRFSRRVANVTDFLFALQALSGILGGTSGHAAASSRPTGGQWAAWPQPARGQDVANLRPRRGHEAASGWPHRLRRPHALLASGNQNARWINRSPKHPKSNPRCSRLLAPRPTAQDRDTSPVHPTDRRAKARRRGYRRRAGPPFGSHGETGR